MKTNEKLKRAFAAADEILFDPVDANAVTPSEEFIRKTGALVRKDRGAGWKILNTTGKRVAAAALALVIVAAAAIGVMALRGDIKGISAVVDSTSVGDRNLIYRSEDGEFSVWKVEPLENPIYLSRISMPISDEMINKPTDVVLGKITDVTEIFIETEHKPDDYYIEGVGYVSDLLRYRSLVSVEVKDSIKGDISAGDTVTFVFAVSSRNMEYTVDYRGKLPKVGEEYVLYLSKTSGLEEGNYYIPIADYYYNASLPCFVPYDEPQRPELLEVIGCEKEISGEAFIHTLKQFYSGDGGDGANVLYRSENGDFVVRKVEPLEKPIYYNLEWSELSEERFKSIPEVVTGTITDISEISVSYEYMGQGVITDYYSLLTVAVNDTITGELTKGKTVKVIFELSTYQMDESNIYPEVGKEYVFFLRDTSTLGKAYDYSTIAEYTYCVRPTCLVPIDEPQDPEYLAFIGAEEGAHGEKYISDLREFYK